MKNIRRIVVWVSLSLFLQVMVLFYLDKFYFVTEKNFKITKIDGTSKVLAKKKNTGIEIPEGAEHVSISYDSKFLSYYKDTTLTIIDTITGSKKEVTFNEELKLSRYKWLPDINSMFIVEKKSAQSNDSLRFSNYDAEKDRKKEIQADHLGNSAYISLPDKKSEVEEIALSPLTNMIYIKIVHQDNKSNVYSMDVMAQIKKLNLNSSSIGKILTFLHEARMAYEDTAFGKVWVTQLSKPITIRGVNNPTLIAVDDEGRLYIGKTNYGKITEIYYGTLDEDTQKWKSISLKVPIDKNNIYVTSDGIIYTNNDSEGIITNLNTGKEAKYKGRFLQMYKGGAVYIADNKLYRLAFD